MDRENAVARGWSHVLSLSDDVVALDAFRRRIGAPASALQLPPKTKYPHLDIMRGPRERALALDGIAVRVFSGSIALMREYRRAKQAGGAP